MKLSYLYLDLGGKGPGLIPSAEARLPVDDRGFLFGDGLFETMLVRDGRIPLLPHHAVRLVKSAEALAIPADPEGLIRAALAVAESAGPGEHALRLTLSRGAQAGRGYTPPEEPAPTLLVTSVPYRRPTGPLSMITASVRVCGSSLTSGHKSLSGLEKVVARAEARASGADEALLLNTWGRVAEGAASNLFIFRGGIWITPPIAEGALPGVMRQRVMDATMGISTLLTPGEVLQAEGVYLTNALMGCVPVRYLDGTTLPMGPPPPDPEQLFAQDW